MGLDVVDLLELMDKLVEEVLAVLLGKEILEQVLLVLRIPVEPGEEEEIHMVLGPAIVTGVRGVGGGAGNPGGSGAQGGSSGSSGTGGNIILIVGGNLTIGGSATISAIG